MTDLKNFLKKLVFIPCVTGFETLSAQETKDACLDFAKGFFNDAYITNSSSIVLVRSCGKKKASRLVFDAHLDTIGFAVSEICENGYLRLSPLGGIDANILPSSEVLILGKSNIRGIFSSIPPHLSKSDSLPQIGQLLVDTGLDTDTLKEKVNIATPAVLFPSYSELLNDKVSATGLDDKICIAAILNAVRNMDTSRLENTDIYVYLSSGEERGGKGSYQLYDKIRPDACIVLDVNFAKEKGSIDGEYGYMSKGPMLSYSSVTSIRLTRFIAECAKKAEIEIQPVNEMKSTGTNADVSARMGLGTATAVLSVPIKYMHSSVELADMCDVQSTSRLLCEFAYMFDKADVCKPKYYTGGTKNEL